MFKKISLLVILTASLTACSNDYTPDKAATAKKIYTEACASCHAGEPADPSKYWTMNKKNANKAYVVNKVKSGGLRMPGFKNINTADLEKISEFVLKHSIIK